MIPSRSTTMYAMVAVLCGLVIYDNRGSILGAVSRSAAREQNASLRPPGPGLEVTDKIGSNQIRAHEPLLDQATLADFEEFVARPLFSANRRPPTTPRPIAPKRKVNAMPNKPRVQLTLLGVIRGSHRTFALINENKNERFHHVQRGDVVAGWQVSLIAPRKVLLEKSGERLVLPLPD